MMLAKFGCMARLQSERVGPFWSRSTIATRRRRVTQPMARRSRTVGPSWRRSGVRPRRARGSRDPRLGRVVLAAGEEGGLGGLLARGRRSRVRRQRPGCERAGELQEADLGAVLVARPPRDERLLLDGDDELVAAAVWMAEEEQVVAGLLVVAKADVLDLGDRHR